MNAAKAAAALNTISVGLGELAEALADEQPERVTPAPAPASTLAALPPMAASATVDKDVCPKHHTPWKEGKYGPFCTQHSDDPAWSKNGYCSITPKNAPKYLEIQAAARGAA